MKTAALANASRDLREGAGSLGAVARRFEVVVKDIYSVLSGWMFETNLSPSRIAAAAGFPLGIRVDSHSFQLIITKP